MTARRAEKGEAQVGTTEIVPVEDHAASRSVLSLVTMESAPDVVLSEAKAAARALQGVIAAKPRKVVMNDKQYLEFEDWQTVGRFYGVTAKEDGEPEHVDFGVDDDGNRVRGFKANAVAVDHQGRELSRATAYCLTDEEKWAGRTKYVWAYVLSDGSGHSVDDPGKDLITWEDNPSKPGKRRPKRERIVQGIERVPLFQLASMAQTRACAKALRNVLSWVAVLGGYGTTPAEELDGMAETAPAATGDEDTVDAEVLDSQGQPLKPEAERVAAAKAEPNPTHDPAAKREPARRPTPARPAATGAVPACAHCGSDRTMNSKKPELTAFYCRSCGKGFGAPAKRTA